MKKIICFTLFYIFVSSFNTKAETNIEEFESQSEEKRLRKVQAEKERYSAYGLNFIMFQSTDGDDHSVAGRFSVKYVFFDCDFFESKSTLGCRPNTGQKYRMFFSYTGESDFYLGQKNRDSEPVINRLHNPAVHFRREALDQHAKLRWIDLGLEHYSNGQVVNAKDTDSGDRGGQFLTEIALQNDDYQYFDTISRESNFFKLAAKYQLTAASTIEASIKAYIDQKSYVTWGELAGRGAHFEDYDLLRINASYSMGHLLWSDNANFGVEYVVGKGGIDTDSLNINISMPLNVGYQNNWSIPFYFRAHFGPMERLSDYTKSINSLGVGLVFNLW